ncbi:hypothetical protein ACFQ0M_29425 [Kitasatospora aburaviensis]
MTTLIRLEILRTLRNRKYLLFTVLYPALMYVFFINAYGARGLAGGLPVKTYFMVSMATFGAVGSVLTGSAQRISLERKSGWTRQLRLTALPGRAYTVAKIAASAVTTLPAILVVFAVGASQGWSWGRAGGSAWWPRSGWAASSSRRSGWRSATRRRRTRCRPS